MALTHCVDTCLDTNEPFNHQSHLPRSWRICQGLSQQDSGIEPMAPEAAAGLE